MTETATLPSEGPESAKRMDIRMFENIRDQLVAGAFRVELFDCSVTQCVDERPVIHKGVGIITQARDGQLDFVLLCQKPDPRFDAFAELFLEDESGKLLPDGSYYDITGHDVSGKRWRSDRQTIGFDQRQELRIEAALSKLVAEQDAYWKEPEKEYKGWYFHRDIKLPIKPGSANWEHVHGSISWVAHLDKHGNTEVKLRAPAEAFADLAQSFHRGISILCGKVLVPMCTYHFAEGVQRVDIWGWRRPPSRNAMVPFVPKGWPYAHLWGEFILLWLGANGSIQELFFRHYVRVVRAYEDDLENSAQVLSASIEGVLKRLYLTDADTDAPFAAMLEQIIEKARAHELALPERVEGVLMAARSRALQPNLNGVFKRLEEQGVFTREIRRAWRDIRHKAAHGELVEPGEEAIQKHLTDFYSCVEAFKRLLFFSIGYNGKSRDYSQRHWPL